MRYRANRNHLHPVLRPDSDDYLNSVFNTTLATPTYDAQNGLINVSVHFEPRNTTIRRAVEAGDAICAAMVYCSSTQYRDKLEASVRQPFVAQGQIPASLVKNRVEVHPAIITTHDIEAFDTTTSHPEYQRQQVKIEEFAPIAADHNWHFEVSPQLTPVRGIFRIREAQGRTLEFGEFDTIIDEEEQYIYIEASPETLETFNRNRTKLDRTIPTIFLSAVLATLANIKESEFDGQENAEECQWRDCILNRLAELDVDIFGNEDQAPNTSIFLAAQKLLGTPLQRIWQWNDGTDDYDLEDEE